MPVSWSNGKPLRFPASPSFVEATSSPKLQNMALLADREPASTESALPLTDGLARSRAGNRTAYVQNSLQTAHTVTSEIALAMLIHQANSASSEGASVPKMVDADQDTATALTAWTEPRI